MIMYSILVTVSAKGRVEDIKLDHSGGAHVFTDMSNRVEHQKHNQVTAELPPG